MMQQAVKHVLLGKKVGIFPVMVFSKVFTAIEKVTEKTL